MARSDETRLALLEERTKNVENNVLKLVEKIEQLTEATQTLNETLIRNESIKDDIHALKTRINKVEIITETIPLTNFKTTTLWGFIKDNVAAIINFLLISGLSVIVTINR